MERFIRAGAILFALVLGTGFVLFQTGDLERVFGPSTLYAGLDRSDSTLVDSIPSFVDQLDSVDRVWLDSLRRDHPSLSPDVIDYGATIRVIDTMAQRHHFMSFSSKSMVVGEFQKSEHARLLGIMTALRNDSLAALIPDTSEAPEIMIPSSKVIIMPSLFPPDSSESPDTTAKTGARKK